MILCVSVVDSFLLIISSSFYDYTAEFLLIHLSIDFFFFLTGMTKASINILVQEFLWTCIFISFEKICKNRITGS